MQQYSRFSQSSPTAPGGAEWADSLSPLEEMRQRLEAELMDLMRSRSAEKLKECLARAKPFFPSGNMVILQAERRLEDWPSAVDGAISDNRQNGRPRKKARRSGGSDIGTASAREDVAQEDFTEQVEQGAGHELCTNWPACIGSREERLVGHLMWNPLQQLYDRGDVYCVACWEYFRKINQNIQGLFVLRSDAMCWDDRRRRVLAGKRTSSFQMNGGGHPLCHWDEHCIGGPGSRLVGHLQVIPGNDLFRRGNIFCEDCWQSWKEVSRDTHRGRGWCDACRPCVAGMIISEHEPF